MISEAWAYVGNADRERIVALQRTRTVSELPSELLREFGLKCFHWEARGDDSSFTRAVFCGEVSPSLFDWFFNAQAGYRGAFFDSPEAGSRENRNLLDGLAPGLIRLALCEGFELDEGRVFASLGMDSAKLWLAEYPGLCPSCAPEWDKSYISALKIRNGRWESSDHVHAAWGQQAPQLKKIRIFGGFRNALGSHWVAPHKEQRATHIWEHGWS